MQTHLILQKYLDRKQRSSQGFSLRLVAARLEISPSFLSRVLTGKKPIPYHLLLRLGEMLEIESETLSALKDSHQVQIEGAASPRRGKAQISSALEEWNLATKSDFRILRQWFYLPILDLTSLSNFDGSIQAVADRLGLSLTTAEVAVRELIANGLLVEVDGRIQKAQKRIRWSAGQSIDEVRKFHDQMLEKAQHELRNATAEEEFAKRLIMGITVTASKEKIEEAKRKLSECLHEIANDLMQDEGDEVYQLAGQFFPLSKTQVKP